MIVIIIIIIIITILVLQKLSLQALSLYIGSILLRFYWDKVQRSSEHAEPSVIVIVDI